jgi:hypothetical protein
MKLYPNRQIFSQEDSKYCIQSGYWIADHKKPSRKNGLNGRDNVSGVKGCNFSTVTFLATAPLASCSVGLKERIHQLHLFLLHTIEILGSSLAADLFVNISIRWAMPSPVQKHRLRRCAIPLRASCFQLREMK